MCYRVFPFSLMSFLFVFKSPVWGMICCIHLEWRRERALREGRDWISVALTAYLF